MGLCKGISSQLELVDQWRPMTADQAVVQFQVREAAAATPTDTRDGGPVHQVPSRSNTTGSPTAAHAVQAVHLSNVLIYPSNAPSAENSNDDNKNKQEKKIIKAGETKPPTTPEGTTSPPPPQSEQWRCYGSTEVDLLVLSPQNSNDDNTIAGVAPYTSPGVTIRDVESPTLGQERTTTIRLSILEILYQNTWTPEDLLNDAKNGKKEGGHNAAPTTKPNQKQSSDDNKETTGTIGPSKVYASGKKILHQMKLNADLLYSSVQEDFPGRTWAASQHVGSEVEKTFVRTYNLIKRVAAWAISGGGGGGNNGGFDGGGGFGPSGGSST
jgi:hypothetical protein